MPDGELRGARGMGEVTWAEGRPDLQSAFEGMAREAEAQGIKRIGVLGCGPEKLTDEVVKIARNTGGRNMHIDVHLEHFY